MIYNFVLFVKMAGVGCEGINFVDDFNVVAIVFYL